MNIKNRLKKEKKEFVDEWIVKKEVGFIRYVLIGSIRSALFLMFMYIIKFLIEWEIQFDVKSVIAVVIVSFLLPLLSWCINEIRFKRREC